MLLATSASDCGSISAFVAARFTHSSRSCIGVVTGACNVYRMLHSVRYLQSQWNARSPELSLKDLVDLIRPSASLALIERARRHYQACRFQCFLRSVAVAVDGPMPTTGALMLGQATDPDFVVGSVRPSLALTPADLAFGPRHATPKKELEAQVLSALQAGLVVYVRSTPLQTEFVHHLRSIAAAHRFPVLDVVLEGDIAKDAPHPLALREVLVRVTPESDGSSAVPSPRTPRRTLNDVH